MATYLCPGLPEELFVAVAEVIGAELVVVTDRSGPDPDDDPLRSGDVDLAWVCSTAYAALVAQPEPSVTLAGLAFAPDDPSVGGRPEYYSDIITRRDSPIHGFDDLAGRKVGGNDEASLSGYHAFRFELRDRGLSPDRFADLVLTGGHLRSIDLVLDGRLDAAAVDSIVFEGRRRREPRLGRELEVVSRLGPWPTQPLVASRSAAAADVDRVRRALLASNDDPTIQALFQRHAVGRLVEVGAGHCAPVIDAYADSH